MTTMLTLDEAIACTRSTVGYVDSTAGVWRQIAANKPRRSNKGLLIEEARTNSIPNNSMMGAAAGSPGTFPTGWGPGGFAGVTRTVVGVGVENGVEYMDVRFNGTLGAADAYHTAFTQIVSGVANGQTWYVSIFLKLVAGTLTNIDSFRILSNVYSPGPVFLQQMNTLLSTPTSTLARSGGAQTISGVGADRVDPHLSILGDADGGAVDFTIRIGWPQYELGAFMTSPIRTTSAAVTRARDLIEVNNPADIINVRAITMLADFTLHGDPTAAAYSGNFPVPMGWHALSSANEVIFYIVGANGQTQLRIISAGVDQQVTPGTSTNARAKIGGAAETDNVRGARNGVLSALNTTFDMPASNIIAARATLGGYPDLINYPLSGYMHRIEFLPYRVTDAELSEMTA
jgi:hypothetical protein